MKRRENEEKRRREDNGTTARKRPTDIVQYITFQRILYRIEVLHFGLSATLLGNDELQKGEERRGKRREEGRKREGKGEEEKGRVGREGRDLELVCRITRERERENTTEREL